MNRCGNVLKSRCHLKGQTEAGRPFRNSGTDTLDAEQKMIVGPGGSPSGQRCSVAKSPTEAVHSPQNTG
jgi:hypothetical protein